MIWVGYMGLHSGYLIPQGEMPANLHRCSSISAIARDVFPHTGSSMS